MWTNANFLFEIGSEEIPAGYIPQSIENAEKLFRDKLNAARIDFADVKVFATPRRLIIVASGVASSQRDEMIEYKGPSADRAYSDGKPTQALLGFLNGNALEEKDLEIKETPKGKYYFGKKRAVSEASEKILPSILEAIIREIPFTKRMKWGSRQVTYPRPIRYILTVFNNKPVTFEVDGIQSSNKTRGHYIQSGSMIVIDSIKDYPAKLSAAKVLFDQLERRNVIAEKLSAAARKCGGTLVPDDELLDIVTYLVEDPHAVICEFNKDFLKIPDIVLITEMREHQKYFAVRDRDGKLTNNFLVIANNPDSPFVKEGNERVIRARFSDAEFFFNEDRKHKLESKIESLKNVLFHKELGSIYAKVERMQKIAEAFCSQINEEDLLRKKIRRAIDLSKADLNTAMVMEFTSLQGKMGRIYATMDGEDPEVADAIEDHYRPRFQGDEIPSNIVSIALSLSEKIDNLIGSYSVGNIPKGSYDPYALRRQANALVELLIHNKLHVDLKSIFQSVAPLYKNGEELIPKILDFINARANTIFADASFSHDEIDACLSIGYYDYYDLHVRAAVINRFRKNAGFSDMLLGFKRMNNLYSSFKAKNKDYQLKLDPSLFAQDEERNLYTFFSSRKQSIEKAISDKSYDSLFSILTEAKPSIDSFFDKVMVMDKDLKIRDNRLALLESILTEFRSLLDFSKISD